jgi:hypothetical protein
MARADHAHGFEVSPGAADGAPTVPRLPHNGLDDGGIATLCSQQAATLCSQQAATLCSQQAATLCSQQAATLCSQQAATLCSQQAATLCSQQAATLRSQQAATLRSQQTLATPDCSQDDGWMMFLLRNSIVDGVWRWNVGTLARWNAASDW